METHCETINEMIVAARKFLASRKTCGVRNDGRGRAATSCGPHDAAGRTAATLVSTSRSVLETADSPVRVRVIREENIA